MSADRTVTVGEWGCSKIRCNGHTAGRQCYATVTGLFRKGITSARDKAQREGWTVKTRVQYAPNGFELRDFCPAHIESVRAEKVEQ